MAKYRQVHIEFWQDGFVLDLTPEEKYFYIYLMTNSKTSQCGIYELPKRIIETETGYNRETVEKLLQRFIDYEKIKYNDSTKEIFMTNWAKYNWINSSKVIKCVEKELEIVKDKDFIKDYLQILKHLGYRIDSLSIDWGEEEEEEEEKEKEEEASADPYHFYQQNFGVLSPFVAESIEKWEKELPSNVLIEAMKRTLFQNKRTWSYTEGILKDWSWKNLKTLEAILAYEREREKSKQSKYTKENKTMGPDIPRNFVYDPTAGEDWE